MKQDIYDIDNTKISSTNSTINAENTKIPSLHCACIALELFVNDCQHKR